MKPKDFFILNILKSHPCPHGNNFNKSTIGNDIHCNYIRLLVTKTHL